MMRFEFFNPTRIIFGAGSVEQLGDAVRHYGKKALLVIGGGSVKRSGAFDRAVSSLEKAGVSVVEFSGIEPNPRLSTVKRAVSEVLKSGCDVVVGLGGGSVMDASKVIAAGVYYEGDLTEMFVRAERKQRLPDRALPVVTVPTLAATGSEMNNGSVITIDEGGERLKTFVMAEVLYPRVAVVDPELTVTVPPDFTAYGISDILAHVTETYFCNVEEFPIQDRFAEGIILTLLEWGPIAVRDGQNVDARAHVQWASIVALNGWIQAGIRLLAPVHMIEHTLSALYDVPHGAGLAVLNPAWMRFALRSAPGRFAKFAERIFGVTGGSLEDRAVEGVKRFEDFLKTIGCPTRLSELGIGDPDDATLQQIAEDTLKVRRDREGRLPGYPALTKEDIIEILRLAM
ncbi:iron-containing alcohol dehydrogenase [Thermodesulforhabdus norvegica]|uniref:Uncharacterized protein n=1 Tax=Thermodesulforhabdus norvegica TaxID=39841 RepID=A0A1I4S6L6_9BACT|nr:iron-containing alcohol dehydrogenase [Thermodesulforhabdus norvegica]SFM60166.1 hypothetical protein SAMN05660836_00792 [Thermodesulforhabdus norvegica]